MADGTNAFTIYWRIENFNCELGDKFYIFSDTFQVKCMDSNWRLILYVINGDLMVSIYKESSRKSFIVYYSIFSLTSSRWNTILKDCKYRFKGGERDQGTQIIDLKKLKEEESIHVLNGCFTISIRMWNSRTTESSQSLMISSLGNDNFVRPIQTFSTLKPKNFLSFFYNYPMTLNVQKTKEVKTRDTQTDTSIHLRDTDDLRKLFIEKEFSFVTLRTPTKEFFEHKAVLCAKSPVFDAMFERKMKEKESSVVDIDDIDSQTMSLLIKFLHFDPLGDLKWSDGVSLYYAADKYQIDSLRKECVSILNKELSVQNICDALLLADLHQDSDLMNCALEYFCNHSKAILPSTQWKDILGHTELVASALCKLAERL